jgi:KaiC/GvpD/RAD55 family RecA-like ATPase
MNEGLSVQLDPAMRAALCRTYADLLRRQRTATTPFAMWSRATKREHEFVWLGPTISRVPLMEATKMFSVRPSDPLWEPVHKMYGTATLNPYEREVLLGFPYVMGRVGTTTVRGPLLTLAVEITAVGDHLEISAVDEVVRFNSLPFRTEGDTDAHSAALNRILDQTPEMPLNPSTLKDFVGIIIRELSDVVVEADLDGTLGKVPAEPRSALPLRIIDQAALFVAPKTNYFLRSDLDEIAGTDGGCGALVPLIMGAGEEAQVDISTDDIDSARIIFPFPSNRAQRRVALMLEDETTHVISVEGPPGTGKSLTIANLACHLAASGKKVLVTSQKDKALEVVDAKLRELNLAELPMTLLRRDKESKSELMGRLDRIDKRRPTGEVSEHYTSLNNTLELESAAQLSDATSYAHGVRCESEIETADRAAALAKGLRRIGARRKLRSTIRRAAKASPETTDIVADRVGERREQLLDQAVGVLEVGLELGVAGANRA